MSRLIIAFTGKLGSGKSAAAAELEELGFTRLKFAGPLKDMMRALGLTEEEIEGKLKEKPCELLCGVTPRRAMQTIGTEWGRDIIHPDLWINAWRRRVNNSSYKAKIVIDDCRYDNEARAVRDLGGTIVRIERPELFPQENAHSSEVMPFAADHTIQNIGSLKDFLGEVRGLARVIQKSKRITWRDEVLS